MQQQQQSPPSQPRPRSRKISVPLTCYEHPERSVQQARSLADAKKDEGNELYKTKNYRDALQRYSEAISLDPECPAYYGNRSACHMMLSQYTQALEDARASVSLDAAFVKGYVRIAKCCLTLGDAAACRQLKISRAECLAFLGRYEESQEVANDLLRADAMNADAIYVRGLCLYYEDNVDKAFTHFQQVSE